MAFDELCWMQWLLDGMWLLLMINMLDAVAFGWDAVAFDDELCWDALC